MIVEQQVIAPSSAADARFSKVDLFGALGDIGQHADVIGQHFDESAMDGHETLREPDCGA